ncbi:MAG: threonylcarbamoyl-AMP synthase [Candidatus Kapabacteria bacterium]|nr:threonylcarbamoyl-AMP synthase [Candidatus Kapabacteria bacterium]
MQQLVIPVHPQTPEQRNIDIIVQQLRKGAVMLYPTDTGMALGCMLNNKNGIERIRRIRNLPAQQSMTFLCDSISNISEYAKVSNSAYRLIKRLIPGPYTFILPCTKAVPNYAHDPKRNTVGIRVPHATIANAILTSLAEPLISITAKDADGNEFATVQQAVESIGTTVDVVVIMQKFSWMDDDLFTGESTIIDMTSNDFTVLRAGANASEVLELIGQEAE